MTAVSLQGLTLHYPGAAAPAVDGLTLDLPAGRLTALLGPSGCGKTTVMKMIAGLLTPSAGDVVFDGRSVLQLPPEARGAVMVFQNHLLFPTMSVADNVGFGLRMRRLPRAEIAARVADMLALVQLPDAGPRRPAALSGGQQQRIALARALIVRPKVLLLDEPLANLDAHLRDEMRELICSVQRATGTTTLIVTHDQTEAMAMADRVALMLDGRLRQDGPPEVLFGQPRDIAVARFFGARNFLAGRVQGDRFDGALGPLQVRPGMGQGAGVLTIRPEALRLGPGANTRVVTVATVQFLGGQTRLRLTAGEQGLEMLVPADGAAGIAPGQSLTIDLPPTALWFLTGSA